MSSNNSIVRLVAACLTLATITAGCARQTGNETRPTRDGNGVITPEAQTARGPEITGKPITPPASEYPTITYVVDGRARTAIAVWATGTFTVVGARKCLALTFDENSYNSQGPIAGKVGLLVFPLYTSLVPPNPEPAPSWDRSSARLVFKHAKLAPGERVRFGALTIAREDPVLKEFKLSDSLEGCDGGYVVLVQNPFFTREN